MLQLLMNVSEIIVNEIVSHCTYQILLYQMLKKNWFALHLILRLVQYRGQAPTVGIPAKLRMGSGGWRYGAMLSLAHRTIPRLMSPASTHQSSLYVHTV